MYDVHHIARGPGGLCWNVQHIKTGAVWRGDEKSEFRGVCDGGDGVGHAILIGSGEWEASGNSGWSAVPAAHKARQTCDKPCKLQEPGGWRVSAGTEKQTHRENPAATAISKMTPRNSCLIYSWLFRCLHPRRRTSVQHQCPPSSNPPSTPFSFPACHLPILPPFVLSFTLVAVHPPL